MVEVAHYRFSVRNSQIEKWVCCVLWCLTSAQGARERKEHPNYFVHFATNELGSTFLLGPRERLNKRQLAEII